MCLRHCIRIVLFGTLLGGYSGTLWAEELREELPAPAGGQPGVLMEEAPAAAQPPSAPGVLMEEAPGQPATLTGQGAAHALTGGSTGGAQSGAAAADDIVCAAGKVCVQSATGLPLRGLPRPFSNLYAEPDANAKVLSSNLKAFWPLYIFARQDVDFSDPANPKGWYQVGGMENDPLGWVQAKDLLEWKQTLVVSYTHPGTGDERRNSVLMFASQEALDKIVGASDRAQQAQVLYQDLGQTPPKVPEGVVSREPSRFVNIEEKFYLLPVIDFKEVDLFDDETRYLQIAAAVPGSRADEANPDTLDNPAFSAQAGQSETAEGTQAKDLGVDIKFVIDMTASMGPYIAGTQEAIKQVAKTLAEHQDMNTRVSFGLIGYRDDLKAVPGLEFTVKNFTPQLLDAAAFDQAIAQAGAATDASGDYTEEVFAGVKEAVAQTPWNENTLKYIVLVGDASSHPAGHKQNTTGLDAQEVRVLADSQKITLIAVHLKAQKYAADHPLAETQFRALASNPGADSAAYLDVAVSNNDKVNQANFQYIAEGLAGELSTLIGAARQGDIAKIMADAPKVEAAGEIADPGEKARKLAHATLAAALVDYLGSAANPPRDLTAWVMDRDLVDPATRALQVRVLLKKRELNDLIQSLESVLKAVKRSQLTSMQFFDALQGVVAQSAKGDKISVAGAKKLSESGLMPAWINSLPYRSAILEMSNERFESLSAEERSNLEYEIEAKLQLYHEINENADLWVALDERDADIDRVYPLSLSALP